MDESTYPDDWSREPLSEKDRRLLKAGVIVGAYYAEYRDFQGREGLRVTGSFTPRGRVLLDLQEEA